MINNLQVIFSLGKWWGWWSHLNAPPGMEMSVMGPSSSSSSGSKSWGWFWSVLSSDVWLQWSSGSPASKHSHMSISFRGMGAAGLAGTSVSMLSSLSSSTTTSESCWRGLSSTMETSLACSLPLILEGCKPKLGLPFAYWNHTFAVPTPSAPGPPRTWRGTSQAPWPLWRPSAGPQALSPFYPMRADGV